MTLIFVGHGFRYETEAVMKLFLPVESFSFVNCDLMSEIPETDGDRCILSRVTYSGCAELTADCRFSGKSAVKSEKAPVSADDYEHLCEQTLCRLMFICMSELTGINPKWGMLTGVRPVKLVSRLLESGMSDEEVCRYMENKYLCTREKTVLAMDASKNQKKCLENLPKNSVSLYISIPFCPSRCAYCSFVSQTVESFKRLIPDYVDRLCDEILLTSQLTRDLGLILDTVYFGGGTPTSLSPLELDRLMKTVSGSFDLSRLREYTVEAGRPDTVTDEKLKVIYENGGDRISVNPQTMQDSVLEAVGRKHTVRQFYEAYEAAAKIGFKAINVDLIAGLPTDTAEGFRNSLERIISLHPENITVHALSVKRAADMMHGDRGLLSAKTASESVALSDMLLPKADYRPYYLYRQKNQLGNLENVGWETGGTAGIYNINMMEEIQTVIAVGAGGSTKIVAGQDKIERFYNPKYPLEYLRLFDGTVAARKREAFTALKRKVCGK